MLKKEIYISVDVEASGSFPEKYSLLSIGATVVGAENKDFYRELRPKSLNFESGALKICANSFSEEVKRHPKRNRKKLETVLDVLYDLGHEPQEVMEDFEKWVKKVSGNGRAVFVGYNSSFDWQFINFYFFKYLGKNLFGHDPIDIKSMYMAKYGEKWSKISKKQIAKKFKIRENDLPHNALYDAREQADIFLKILE